jgi:hypothetical protein
MSVLGSWTYDCFVNGMFVLENDFDFPLIQTLRVSPAYMAGSPLGTFC